MVLVVVHNRRHVKVGELLARADLKDAKPHPELKVSTPAHTRHLGWYVEFEFRVMQHCVWRGESVVAPYSVV